METDRSVHMARKRRDEAAVLKGTGQAAVPRVGRGASKARLWVLGDSEK